MNQKGFLGNKEYITVTVVCTYIDITPAPAKPCPVVSPCLFRPRSFHLAVFSARLFSPFDFSPLHLHAHTDARALLVYPV